LLVVVQAVGGSSPLAHPPKLAANEPFLLLASAIAGSPGAQLGHKSRQNPALWAGRGFKSILILGVGNVAGGSRLPFATGPSGSMPGRSIRPTWARWQRKATAWFSPST